MRFEIQNSIIDRLKRERAILVIAMMLSLAVIGILTITGYRLLTQQKTILMFPNGDDSVWLTPHALSPNYVAQMAHFLAGLRFNMNPENARYQNQILLRYLAPTLQAIWKEKLQQEAQKIEREHLTLAFFPEDTVVLEHQATLIGTLQTWVNGLSLATQKIEITFEIGLAHGKPQLINLTEEKRS